MNAESAAKSFTFATSNFQVSGFLLLLVKVNFFISPSAPKLLKLGGKENFNLSGSKKCFINSYVLLTSESLGPNYSNYSIIWSHGQIKMPASWFFSGRDRN